MRRNKSRRFAQVHNAPLPREGGGAFYRMRRIRQFCSLAEQHSSLCRLIPILGGLFSILDLTNIHLTHIVDPGDSAFEFLGDGLRNSRVL